MQLEELAEKHRTVAPSEAEVQKQINRIHRSLKARIKVFIRKRLRPKTKAELEAAIQKQLKEVARLRAKDCKLREALAECSEKMSNVDDNLKELYEQLRALEASQQEDQVKGAEPETRNQFRLEALFPVKETLDSIRNSAASWGQGDNRPALSPLRGNSPMPWMKPGPTGLLRWRRR